MLRAAFRSWKQLASTAVLECGGNRSPPLSYSVASASPLWHLKPTKAKVLIQHGEIDDRVPLSQGTMLYRILDELGVDVKMVTYPRTAHGPCEPKLRMDMMRRNLELFRPLAERR